MGDICLDRDELGWSPSCSFESFGSYAGDATYLFACHRPFQPKNIKGNSEIYCDASASWEIKKQEE